MNPTLILASIILLFAPVPAQAFSRKVVGPMVNTHEKELSAHLQVNSATNSWTGFTGSFEEEKAGFTVEATVLDPAWAKLDTLANYAIDGDPLISIDRKNRRVHLSAVHFSGSFERIDATRIAAAARKLCGYVKASSPLLKQPGNLVRFLLQSHLIRTYMHLESNLHLIREVHSEDGRFVSQWQGEHVYFTNERNVSSIQFSVILDARTGMIEVAGN